MSSHEFPGLTGDQITALIQAYAAPILHNHQDAAGGGQLDHGLALTGLLDDDHTQYARLGGRSGGQSLIGGTASGNTLTMSANTQTNGGTFIQLGSGSTAVSVGIPTRTDTSGSLTIVNVSGIIQAASDSSVQLSGMNFAPVLRGAVNYTNNIRGVYSTPKTEATGTTALLVAFGAIPSKEQSGTLTDAYGFLTAPSVITGAITTLRHYAALDAAGSGTVGTQYGIQIGNMLKATTNYAIQTNAGLVVFNDGGHPDADVRMEGDTNANLFVLDAGLEVISIGEAVISGVLLNVAGLLRTDSFRIDQTPTAETPTATHTVTINLNGTNYKLLCVAA